MLCIIGESRYSNVLLEVVVDNLKFFVSVCVMSLQGANTTHTSFYRRLLHWNWQQPIVDSRIHAWWHTAVEKLVDPWGEGGGGEEVFNLKCSKLAFPECLGKPCLEKKLFRTVHIDWVHLCSRGWYGTQRLACELCCIISWLYYLRKTWKAA